MDRLKRFYIKLHIYLFLFFVAMMAVFSFGEDNAIMVYLFFTCALCTVGWLIFYLFAIRGLKKLFQSS